MDQVDLERRSSSKLSKIWISLTFYYPYKLFHEKVGLITLTFISGLNIRCHSNNFAKIIQIFSKNVQNNFQLDKAGLSNSIKKIYQELSLCFS